MFATLTALVALLALVLFHCKALTLPPNDGSLATIPYPVARDPANSLGDVQTQCNGVSYGTGINYASCLDAFGTFTRGRDTRPITVGPRGVRVGLSLPNRWISGVI